MADSSRRRVAKRRRIVLGGAAVLFVGVFAARLAVHDPGALLANFYTVPIALLAIEFGLRGGMVGALVGFALVVAWGAIQDVDVGVLGYASRAALFLSSAAWSGVLGPPARRHSRPPARPARTRMYAGELERANDRLAHSVLRLEAFARSPARSGARPTWGACSR